MSGVAEATARRDDFDAVAEQRYARIVESRMTIPWSEMRCYLEGRVTGSGHKEAASIPFCDDAGDTGVGDVRGGGAD